MDEHEEYIAQHAEKQTEYSQDSDYKSIKPSPRLFQSDACQTYCSYDQKQTSHIQIGEKSKSASQNAK